MSTQPYKNSRRSGKGSQQETPTVKCNEGQCIVGGYQHFTITHDILNVTGGYQGKFAFIKNFLRQHRDCESVMDVGASNGLVAFTAVQLGFRDVHALDHDVDCIKLIDTINDELDLNTNAIKWSFGDPHPACDIVIVGALIHWVYSCTALYGNFDEIVTYLHGLTNQHLLIEWVNPNDPAIRSFKHTTFNNGIIKEPYTRERFIHSLHKHFSRVQKVYSVNGTRELFHCVV